MCGIAIPDSSDAATLSCNARKAIWRLRFRVD
jgi:hypothetical protein